MVFLGYPPSQFLIDNKKCYIKQSKKFKCQKIKPKIQIIVQTR